jgi:hypothetical protein
MGHNRVKSSGVVTAGLVSRLPKVGFVATLQRSLVVWHSCFHYMKVQAPRFLTVNACPIVAVPVTYWIKVYSLLVEADKVRLVSVYKP